MHELAPELCSFTRRRVYYPSDILPAVIFRQICYALRSQCLTYPLLTYCVQLFTRQILKVETARVKAIKRNVLSEIECSLSAFPTGGKLIDLQSK